MPDESHERIICFQKEDFKWAFNFFDMIGLCEPMYVDDNGECVQRRKEI